MNEPIIASDGTLVSRADWECGVCGAAPGEACDESHYPCPRCGRSDFRTANGRAWHVANAPDCRRYVNREKHSYQAVAA